MTQAFRDFLTKLPPELLHYHFGDTDPAGWSILEKLRQASPRPVLPFHMRWRPSPSVQPLNMHDRGLLPKLLASPLLADVHDEIHIMARLEDRGTFEQESLGAPNHIGWPFYD